MKVNWFKYVFIVVIITILIVSIVIIKQQEEQKNEQIQNEAIQKEKDTEIRLAIAELDTINPILSNNKNVQTITKVIYEPLINITSDFKLEAALAKEWAKQNNNTYLIKLRENVKWSDGKRFTASDVQFTIDRLKDTPSVYSYQMQNVVQVDILDDYTLSIKLDQEIPFFEYYLTFPIMSKEYYEGEDFATSAKNSSPVGTGKFKISDVQPSYITLEKNPNYWNKETKFTLDKITINLYSSIGELYNSFKIGSIDLIATDNDKLQDYIGTLGYSLKEIKGREHTFLALNTANQFLSDVNVRKAIAYSIDKENIISGILNNKAYSSYFPLDYGSFLANQQNTSSGYNPEQAQQVLTESGWSFKYQSWQKTQNYKTQKLQLNLLVNANDETNVAVADNIKNQLASQGIIINIIQAQQAQYTNSVAARNYDIALCNMTMSVSPNLSTFFGDSNLANYSTDEVSSILSEVSNSNDQSVLLDRFSRLSEIYKNDVPYVSLFSNKCFVAYSSALVGDIEPSWFGALYNVESWYK